MRWSVDGQTPEFLAATRMITLSDPIVDAILADLKLEPGMRVLDVGCGSGEYGFRLGTRVSGVHFTGLELDDLFVDFARKRAAGEVGYPYETPNPANAYEFVCANGLAIPFEDGAFDAVISHTYLTALPDWASALAEMCRVCKPGGTVSSVTSMTDDFYGTGTVELFTGLLHPDDAQLLLKVERAWAETFPSMDLASGIAPRKAPVAFDWMGLESVRCVPLGQYFCLSDGATAKADYLRHVELLYAMERARARHLSESAGASGLTRDEWSRYEALIEARRGQLVERADRNREWNWYGNASLLVSGTVPEGGLSERCRGFHEQSAEALRMQRICADLGLAVEPRMTQIGPGRCVRAEFGVGAKAGASDRAGATPAEPITVFGFNPPKALKEGYAKLLLAHGEIDLAQLSPERRGRVEREAQLAAMEARHPASPQELAALPELPNDAVFATHEIWETVAEAAQAGIPVRFMDAGTDDGAALVACVAEGGARQAAGLAAHPDLQTAIQRSLARALGAIM